MTESVALEDVALRALAGDRASVGTLVRELQGKVYALSLRILWNPQDAEDATQEILVRVVTRLSQFDFRSRLTTWVYRVATNYLLDVRKSCVERANLTFTGFSEDLLSGLSDAGPNSAEDSVLTEEVKIGCTLAMLQCLDRPHRIAYVLGEIFELSAPDAASAMSIDAGAFRKRLERARLQVEAFTRRHCGLVAESAPCACHRRVVPAINLGRVSRTVPLFAVEPSSFATAREFISRVEDVQRVVALHRSVRPGEASTGVARFVMDALETEPVRS